MTPPAALGGPDRRRLACSFCGRWADDSARVLEGPGVQICDACVELCHEAVTETRRSTRSWAGGDSLPTPWEMRGFLDGHVIGQDHAKRTLCVAVYNHYKRVRRGSEAGPEAVELAKSNVLLLGPTGCGKTLLTQSLARLMDMPFVTVDVTGLTEAGYVGRDVDGILAELLQAAGDDVRKAETGIVHLDEVDKLARSEAGSTGRDVSGEGVQQALLKILEGSVVTLSGGEHGAQAVRGRGYSAREPVTIDTSGILFIAAGAFSGVEDIVASRRARSSTGFSGAAAPGRAPTTRPGAAGATPADLVTFGLIPEFIGRFPVIAALDGLGRQDMLSILTQPRNALVKQYQTLFDLDGVELEFEAGALEAVADEAIARETGARGLRSILEDFLMPAMYDIPSLDDVVRVRVTADVVTHGAAPVLTVGTGGRRAAQGRSGR